MKNNGMIKKTKEAIEKKVKTLQKLEIKYTPIDSIKPNIYNPNRQSEFEFELLKKSIKEDGFTQPILIKANGSIVDGEHRWRACKELGFTEIPTVEVDMSDAQMRIATLRHNRARGSEDMELTAQVLRDLQNLGAMDWAKDSLQLSDMEINKLIEDMPAPELQAGKEFNEAWIPIASVPTEGEFAGASYSATDSAYDKHRELEAKLKEAKSEEEKKMAVESINLFKLTIVFSGEEAIIVKKALGEVPAKTILQLCTEKLKGENK